MWLINANQTRAVNLDRADSIEIAHRSAGGSCDLEVSIGDEIFRAGINRDVAFVRKIFFWIVKCQCDEGSPSHNNCIIIGEELYKIVEEEE